MWKVCISWPKTEQKVEEGATEMSATGFKTLKKKRKKTLKPPASRNSWSVTRIKCPLSVLIWDVSTEHVLLLSPSRIPRKQEMRLLDLFRHCPPIIGFQGDIRAEAINTHHTCWLRNVCVLTGMSGLWKTHTHTHPHAITNDVTTFWVYSSAQV